MTKIFKKGFFYPYLIRLLKTVQWAISRLPRGFIYCCLRGLFAIAYIFLTTLRQICIRNLQAVYGNTKSSHEYHVMVKRIIKNIGYSMMDMLYFVDRPKELLAITTIHHEERLKEALQFGRGAIMITAHLGNFPLMFEALVQKGYQVNVVIRPMRDPRFGKFMHDECAKWNIRMIELMPQKEFLKKSLSALHRNELLFIMLDETTQSGSGVKVNFFNKQVERATGPLLFHNRVGSPVIPAFIIKNEQEKFEIFIEEALKDDENVHEELVQAKGISALTKVIEEFVKRYPLQWGGWLNKRWN